MNIDFQEFDGSGGFTLRLKPHVSGVIRLCILRHTGERTLYGQ